MAMALPPPDNSSSFSRSLLADYDIADTRYPANTFPTDSSLSRSAQPPSSLWPVANSKPDYRSDTLRLQDVSNAQQSTTYDSQPAPNSTGRTPRVYERPSYDAQPTPSQDRNRTSQYATLTPGVEVRPIQLTDIRASMADSAPRHPNIPTSPGNTPFNNPIIPLSASPTYAPPISLAPRAQPLQPTYITQATSPNAVNPVYSLAPPRPQEEVCVECAMRDQDMAGVDVMSPGAWERESDGLYEDLKRQEKEDEANGIPPSDQKPKSSGHLLSEKNVKFWLSINPREPASRQRTLVTYVKSQRALLEKEALAHAQAVQESKQLDSRMRDAYSQLRRSAYDIGSSAAPIDDSGGVRIKPPQSPAFVHPPPHNQTHSRDVTLLENGMIIEHVDVRREEREARDRRRREERRVRKSSRGSAYDVTSIISNQSYAPPDSLKPYSRYSQTSTGRPISVLTNPMERPDIPRAYSQASFSDVQSLNSASPRRSRFFGNLGSGWRSQNSLAPSGFSGSMVDMHLALQHDAHTRNSVFDPNTLRQSRIWPAVDPHQEGNQSQRPDSSYEPSRKKKKGLAKIWDKMKGGKHKNDVSSHDTPHVLERNMADNYALTPPPPLSYLVRGEANGRHVSTPSLSASNTAQKVSGSYAPEHPEISNGTPRQLLGVEEQERNEDTISKVWNRNVHPVTSEPDFRRRFSQAPPNPSVPPIPNPGVHPEMTPVPVVRDKSLPPLPPGERASPPETRPQTLYTSDPTRTYGAPQPPFLHQDARRQSFGDLTARPDTSSSMPPGRQTPSDTRRPFAPNSTEIGASRDSLGNLSQIGARNTTSSPAPSKRKSKFGLSSLFSHKTTETLSDENTSHGLIYTQDMGSENGYAYSRNSTFNGRSSVASKRALDEVVAQDPEFVAYRYPSSEQRLDLFRPA